MIAPPSSTKEAGEILAGISNAAEIVPDLPDDLYEAGKKDRLTFTMALLSYIRSHPEVGRQIPLIIAKARAGVTDSGNLDALWGLFLSSPAGFRKSAARAGYPVPSILRSILNFRKWLKACTGAVKYKSMAPFAILTPPVGHAELLFDRVLENPQGLWIGKAGESNMSQLRTADRKINLYIPEMDSWMAEITADDEAKALTPAPAFPLILNAGRHIPENANTLMRKPDWNKGRRACTLAMHPTDAGGLDLSDGETVRIITETASVKIELEVTDDTRRGQVLMPHGFGLTHGASIYGVNVNRLTQNTHRDRLAGTPLHRYVPCRVEKISSN